MVTLEERPAWEDRGMMLRTAHEKPASVTHTALWDCVDQAWAGPFPTPQIHNQYLRKQVVICSACNYMSDRRDRNIRSHVELVKKQAREHAGAELSLPVRDDRGFTRRVCSGCDASFSGSNGMEHISRMNSNALGHGYVEALLVNKFALTCSELTILGREVIISESGVDGPVTSQVAQTAPPRKRRRRRRKQHGKRD